MQSLLSTFRLSPTKKKKLNILQDVSGIIKPSRFVEEVFGTLLLERRVTFSILPVLELSSPYYSANSRAF